MCKCKGEGCKTNIISKSKKILISKGVWVKIWREFF